MSRTTGTALYAVAAAVAMFELGVAWLSLHPDVSADYRAYYIDQTTTCLNEPVSGQYIFGTEVTFRSGYEKTVQPLKVCGWEGPVGDGLHAVGESARLRFALPPGLQALHLMIKLDAVDFSAPKGQEVEVVANGTSLGTVHVGPGDPQRFAFIVPEDVVLKHPAALEVELKFPDAIRVSPQDSNTRKRSIRLVGAEVSA